MSGLKKRVIVLGLSFHGRALVRKLIQDETVDLVAIFDNDSLKRGNCFNGIKIIGPEDIKTIGCDQYAVAGRYIPDLIDQFSRQFGISYNKIQAFSRQEIMPDPSLITERSKRLDSILEFLIPYFTDNQIDYWLDRSGLLGLVRGQDLAQMSDVEITIRVDQAEILNQLIADASDNFRVDIFKSSKQCNYRCREIQNIYAVNIIKNSVDYEIIEPPCVTLLPNNFSNSIIKYVNKKPIYAHDYFDSFAVRRYKAFNLRIPLNHERYLEQLYGVDWRQPAQFWFGYKK